MNSERKVLVGLDKLITTDSHLLIVDVGERAITHRLGMYYQELFPAWDVDCEYNRHFKLPKDIQFDIRNLLNRMAHLLRERRHVVARDLMGHIIRTDNNISEEFANLEEQLRNPVLEYDAEQDLYFFLLRLLNGETLRKQIIPDIIVHKRNRKNNFIAVEVKKTSNPSLASREYDLLKLQALITDARYNYKKGYFIDMPVLEDFEQYSEFFLTPDPFEPRVTLVLPR